MNIKVSIVSKSTGKTVLNPITKKRGEFSVETSEWLFKWLVSNLNDFSSNMTSSILIDKISKCATEFGCEKETSLLQRIRNFGMNYNGIWKITKE